MPLEGMYGNQRHCGNFAQSATAMFAERACSMGEIRREELREKTTIVSGARKVNAAVLVSHDFRE